MIKKKSVKYKALTGGEAAAEAMKQINPDVFSAYPITPQTPIIQSFAQKVADGEVSTKFVLVESEHSAMSVVVGAAASGVRAMTATSSQGLALMVEVLPIASGLRLPIVMNLATRALSAPINIHNDHQDAMLARDLGWIQIFCENNQEVYDNNFLALCLAEEMSLPIMICQDGFITSHNTEKVEIISDNQIKKFIKKYQPKFFLLNLKKPITIGPLALPDYYFEIKKQVNEAMLKTGEKYLFFGKELSKITKRNYKYFEAYQIKDAKAVIVALGSTAGTIKFVVDKMRKKNKKVGLLKINLFRPFPYQEIKEILKKVLAVGVFDRTLGFGSYAPLAGEIKHCLNAKQIFQDFSYGLGGREIDPEDIEKTFEDLLKIKKSGIETKYLGLRK